MCLQQQRVPLRWYPPEYFKNHYYGFKGDVWAFGIVLWEMQTFGELEAHIRKCVVKSQFLDLFVIVICYFRHAAVSGPGDIRGSCVPH